MINFIQSKLQLGDTIMVIIFFFDFFNFYKNQLNQLFNIMFHLLDNSHKSKLKSMIQVGIPLSIILCLITVYFTFRLYDKRKYMNFHLLNSYFIKYFLIQAHSFHLQTLISPKLRINLTIFYQTICYIQCQMSLISIIVKNATRMKIM